MSTYSTRLSANPISRSFVQGRAKSQTADRETLISQIEPKPSRGLMSRLGAGKIAGLFRCMRACNPCRLFRGCFNRSSSSNPTYKAVVSSHDESDSSKSDSSKSYSSKSDFSKSDFSQERSVGANETDVYCYSDLDLSDINQSDDSSSQLQIYTDEKSSSQDEVQGSINDDLSQSASRTDEFKKYGLKLRARLLKAINKSKTEGDGKMPFIKMSLTFVCGSAEKKITTLANLLIREKEINNFLKESHSKLDQIFNDKEEKKTTISGIQSKLNKVLIEQEEKNMLLDGVQSTLVEFFQECPLDSKKEDLALEMTKKQVEIKKSQSKTLIETSQFLTKKSELEAQSAVLEEQFKTLKKQSEDVTLQPDRFFDFAKKLHDKNQLIEAVENWRHNANQVYASQNNDVNTEDPQVKLTYRYLMENLGLLHQVKPKSNLKQIISSDPIEPMNIPEQLRIHAMSMDLKGMTVEVSVATGHPSDSASTLSDSTNFFGDAESICSESTNFVDHVTDGFSI